MGHERIYPADFAREYIPLKQEIKDVFLLALPRFGHSPRIAFLKLTDACQMDCDYCNANEVKGRGMNTDELFNVLNNLSQGGIQIVDLSGGEPTLKEDLPEIISHAKEVGIKKITLSTNGGINKGYEYLYQLAEAGLFGVTFSFDGIGEKNDRRVIDLASFSANYLHIYAGVRMVVREENIHMVPEIGSLCLRNNVFFEAIPAVALDGETSASLQDFTPLDHRGRLKLVGILSDLSKERGPFANFMKLPKKYLKEVVSSENPRSWHCENPSSHWISVDAQGDIRVCNDVALKGKNYSLTGKDNPLLTEDFYKDVDRQAADCPGCSWYCHWDGNRGQIERGIDEFRHILTIGAYT